jgi:hypothetical protein
VTLVMKPDCLEHLWLDVELVETPCLHAIERNIIFMGWERLGCGNMGYRGRIGGIQAITAIVSWPIQSELKEFLGLLTPPQKTVHFD